MVTRSEQHFAAATGRDSGIDVEWAKDGPGGSLYILQARPETVQSRRALTALERFELDEPPAPLLTGRAVGTRVATGRARVVLDSAHLEHVQAGDVLVAGTTSPDWGTVMKRAAAIVTATGGRTCHVAIVARKLGIPAVVGAGEALQRIRDGATITVSCASGSVGRVYDGAVPFRIERLVRSELSPAEFFVRRLAEGVATMAAALYPRPVLPRLSDFKSNQYAYLLGGRAFEPSEENPMLGSRGAARYVHLAYAEGFALKCAAVRRVRMMMGLGNVQLMVPFCRSVGEARRVVEALASYGLRRGVDGLELYVMCEIPNNVIQAAEFARYFDGFSIGSNDLTQLVLGVDRDSALVAEAFDERDPGVMEFIRMAIERVHAAGRTIGICGQAPSDHPDFAEFLVRCGIDSISLNPDSLVAVTERVYALEQELRRS